MTEKSFKLKRDSELYRKYFISEAEKEKFKTLANAFFDKIGYEGAYTLSERLHVRDEYFVLDKYFHGELCKNPEAGGLYRFKANSPTQKRWEREVLDKIDFKAYRATNFWYFKCFMRGKYSLWDYNDDVYGYIESDGEINLTDDMEEIKMSEYYRVIEEMGASDRHSFCCFIDCCRNSSFYRFI